MRIVVSRLDEFPPGARRMVQAGRRSIGVFRVGERFFAINNYCPHQGGPLCLGRTKQWVTSPGPGQYAMAAEDALLACPWHGWEYDLATGQSFLGPGEPSVRTYAVTVECGDGEGGAVGRGAVGRGDPDGPVPRAERQPGPYVAETFPVYVEDAYVVVETTARPTATPDARSGGAE